MISGDQVLPKISSNVSVFPTEPDGDPLTDWVTSLARIKTRIPDDCARSARAQRPVPRAPRADRPPDRRHERGWDRLHELIAEPKRVVDVFHVLFRRTIDQNLLGMATGEALAHLNCLMARGWRVRERDADGVDWYRAAAA
jgi:hypothetical protein